MITASVLLKQLLFLSKTQKKVNKEGEPVFISKGSYSKFSQALEGYCSEVMREYVKEYDMNLSEVKRVLESLKEEIKAFDVSDSKPLFNLVRFAPLKTME